MLNNDQFSYRGNHSAPDEESGAPMHDVEDVMPDFYAHPEYYTSGEDFDRESVRAIGRVHGKPDASVTVYRGAPSGVNRINHGDWVTPSQSYAKRHGYDATDPSKDWPVVSATVRASELRNSGDSMHEFGYTGEGVDAAPPVRKPARASSRKPFGHEFSGARFER